MRHLSKLAGLGLVSAALALGVGGQAVAASSFLICGYQADDGSTWETRYVYPATRQCPAVASRNGVEGRLVYQERLES